MLVSNNKGLDSQDKVQFKTSVIEAHRSKRAYLVASMEIQQLAEAGDDGGENVKDSLSHGLKVIH